MNLSPTEINVKSKISYFLKPCDVAACFGVSISTVRRAIKNGDIPFRKIGRCYFIHPDFLETITLNVINNATNNATKCE